MSRKLTDEQLQFIINNKGVLKQKVIAARCGVSPAAICKILKPQVKEVISEEYFDIDKEVRLWGINYGGNGTTY
jgi:predicted transcriptional regulator